MSVDIELVGFKELEAELEKLSDSAGKGVLRRSLKKAAEPTADLARQYVPKVTHQLEKSIQVQSRLAFATGRNHRAAMGDDRAAVEMFIGPTYERFKGYHAHLVEFGTGPHMNKGQFAGTWNPGTPPRPFLRKAWDEDRHAMLDRLGKILWQEVSKRIARAERKAARDALKGV